MPRDISCNQIKQITTIWLLDHTQITLHSTGHHDATWWSAVTWYRVESLWEEIRLRGECEPSIPLITMPHGGQLWPDTGWKACEKRQGLEVSVNPLFHSSRCHMVVSCDLIQGGKLVRKAAGLRAQCRNTPDTDHHQTKFERVSEKHKLCRFFYSLWLAFSPVNANVMKNGL